MRLTVPIAALIAGLAAPAFAAIEGVGPLVNAEWLKANAGNEKLVIIDLRDKIEEVELGDKPFIENAVVAPYASYGWRSEVAGVPGQIPSVEQIAKLIGDLGVDADEHVVLVPWGTDASEFGGATRVYWTLKYLGHDGVSILDGGWRQYDAAGLPRVAEPAKPQPTTFDAKLNPALIATTADVEAALKDGTKLIDGRPEAQFLGQGKSPVVRTEGTIPGALNLPNGKLYSADYASFAQLDTINALTEGLGLAKDEKNIAFCNTGHWASIIWFGLSEIQGNKNTTMYDGSMAEWAADDARPIQVGAK